MAFSYCFTRPLSLKVNCIGQPTGFQHNVQERRFASALKNMSTTPLGQHGRMGIDLYNDWTFLRGSRVVLTPKFSTHTSSRRSFGVYASCSNYLLVFYM
ncbi:hypothetical protein SLEP1_g27387 [Rubroshorea leprosula]|uniref:Uncharacterized protein n=1 Tax=Rubroshorea leprosula TaxID=152421 RepID=A0AAV5JWR0_9ROSI|nr:hypothetical protein SLEP1_g27387 [Rubroshorea leprosula]